MPGELPHLLLHPGATSEDQRVFEELVPAIRRYLVETIVPALETLLPSPPDPLSAAHGRSGQGNPEERGSLYPACRLSLAREVYLFATASELRQDEDVLNRALTGARELLGQFSWEMDDGNGTSPSGVESDGTYIPMDDLFFGVSALATCGRVTGDAALVEGAAALFRRVWGRGRVGPSGGFCEGFRSDGMLAERFCGPAAYLEAIESCSSLLAATGDEEWRKQWLGTALLLVAGFYDPAAGLLGEEFRLERPAGVDGTGSAVNEVHNIRAARVLLRTATELEEPGFADVGRRLLDSMLQRGMEGPDAGIHPADFWESMSLSAQAEALAALAGYYRLRPSRNLLERLEEVWASILNSELMLTPSSEGDGAGGLEAMCRLVQACVCL